MAEDTHSMFCYQCEMSAPAGCGAKNQPQGTCGKHAHLARLQDLMLFGLKGLAAYRERLREWTVDTQAIDDTLSETLSFTLTNMNFSFNEHVAQLMKLGQAGIRNLNLLSDAHIQNFGIPTPVHIAHNQAEGQGILVSGHNLNVLAKLLQATADRGIHIYTHSELLPAHAYPQLRQYPHLKGHIGGAWHDQNQIFERWQGPIVMSSGCLAMSEPQNTYPTRLFTYKVTGLEGSEKIEDDDFTAVIDKALHSPKITDFQSTQSLLTGHHYKTVLNWLPELVEAMKYNHLNQIFVVSGCDAPGKERLYYRQLVCSLPSDTLIITHSCGKFRFNDIDFGVIPGTSLSRYLDLGQCNDSNGVLHLLLALSQALDKPVNELPIAFIFSWLEQKALIILLALLSLGIKDIYLGPKLPQMFDEKLLSFLVKHFNLHRTTTVSNDLARIRTQHSA